MKEIKDTPFAYPNNQQDYGLVLVTPEDCPSLVKEIDFHYYIYSDLEKSISWFSTKLMNQNLNGEFYDLNFKIPDEFIKIEPGSMTIRTHDIIKHCVEIFFKEFEMLKEFLYDNHNKNQNMSSYKLDNVEECSAVYMKKILTEKSRYNR